MSGPTFTSALSGVFSAVGSLASAVDTTAKVVDRTASAGLELAEATNVRAAGYRAKTEVEVCKEVALALNEMDEELRELGIAIDDVVSDGPMLRKVRKPAKS